MLSESNKNRRLSYDSARRVDVNQASTDTRLSMLEYELAETQLQNLQLETKIAKADKELAKLHTTRTRAADLSSALHKLGIPASPSLTLLTPSSSHTLILAHPTPELEDTLVSTLKTLASDPSSPWSRMLPALSGNRTPEDYRATIDMVLALRREVRGRTRAARYWKAMWRTAGGAGMGVTPSSSALEDMIEELDVADQLKEDEKVERAEKVALMAQSAGVPFPTLPSPTKDRPQSTIVAQSCNPATYRSASVSTRRQSAPDGEKTTVAQRKRLGVIIQKPSHVPDLARLSQSTGLLEAAATIVNSVNASKRVSVHTTKRVVSMVADVVVEESVEPFQDAVARAAAPEVDGPPQPNNVTVSVDGDDIFLAPAKVDTKQGQPAAASIETTPHASSNDPCSDPFSDMHAAVEGERFGLSPIEELSEPPVTPTASDFSFVAVSVPTSPTASLQSKRSSIGVRTSILSARRVRVSRSLQQNENSAPTEKRHSTASLNKKGAKSVVVTPSSIPKKATSSASPSRIPLAPRTYGIPTAGNGRRLPANTASDASKNPRTPLGTVAPLSINKKGVATAPGKPRLPSSAPVTRNIEANGPKASTMPIKRYADRVGVPVVRKVSGVWGAKLGTGVGHGQGKGRKAL